MLGYVPQDLVGEVSYQYYHPDNLHKMVQLHQNGQCVCAYVVNVCVCVCVCVCVRARMHACGQCMCVDVRMCVCMHVWSVCVWSACVLCVCMGACMLRQQYPCD